MVGRSKQGGRAGGVRLSNQHWQGFCKNPWSQCRLEAGRGHQKVGKARQVGNNLCMWRIEGLSACLHSFIHSTSIQPVRIDGGAWRLEPGWLLGWLEWSLDRQGLDFKSELKSLEESSSEVLNLFAIP